MGHGNSGSRGVRYFFLIVFPFGTARCSRFPGLWPAFLGNSEALGTALFQYHLLPFEIASLLLLAALIGSVVMAKKRI